MATPMTFGGWSNANRGLRHNDGTALTFEEWLSAAWEAGAAAERERLASLRFTVDIPDPSRSVCQAQDAAIDAYRRAIRSAPPLHARPDVADPDPRE